MLPKDLLLALVVIIVWGMNFVVIKIGLDDMPPMLLGALRFLLAAFPAVLFIKRPQIPLRWLLAAGLWADYFAGAVRLSIFRDVGWYARWLGFTGAAIAGAVYPIVCSAVAGRALSVGQLIRAVGGRWRFVADWRAGQWPDDAGRFCFDAVRGRYVGAGQYRYAQTG
jgi:drug/metabolite transporter (DMT)-like permease